MVAASMRVSVSSAGLGSGMLFRALRLAVILAAAGAVLTVTGVGCIARTMTGIPCPGCGMTRAYLALLRGDAMAAAAYHPLFWTVPVAAVLMAAQGVAAARACAGPAGRARRARRMARACTAALVLLAVAFGVLWLVRMADPRDAGLLFGGAVPAGVEADIVHVGIPTWVRLLTGG